MTKDRLKTLLIACLHKFYTDEYDKDRIMYDIGMTSTEYKELMRAAKPQWYDCWSNLNDDKDAFEVGTRVMYINDADAGTTYYPPLGTKGTVLACERGAIFVQWDISIRGDTKWYCRAIDVLEVTDERV